jgi:hypothetical protein
MKNAVYFFLLFLVMSSCSITKKPIFIKVDQVEVVTATSDTVRLKAAAFFENPNSIGGTISSDKIEVFVNGEAIATVVVSPFKVPAKEEFFVPLTAVIPTKRIFENNKNGILGGLLNSFLKKSIQVQFKGNLKYKVLGFSKTYLVDKTTQIKF